MRALQVLSISLRNVDIHEDASDPRQLKIITPTGEERKSPAPTDAADSYWPKHRCRHCPSPHALPLPRCPASRRAGFIFLRASLPEERAAWMECLRESVRLYRANQGLVEKLKDKGLLTAEPVSAHLGGGAL